MRQGKKKKVSELDLVIETTQRKTQEGKKNPKDEKNVSELWDNFRQPKIHMIRVSKERERWTKKYLNN